MQQADEVFNNSIKLNPHKLKEVNLMKHPRILAIVLVAVLCLSMLPMAIAEDKAPVTIRFSWWGGDSRNAATMEVINQFQALYPWITVQAEYGSSDGYHDKLATQLSSGTAPDLMQIDPETMPAFVRDGDYFVNLFETDFDFKYFDVPSIMASTITGCYEGKQLGLPTGIAGPCMLINKALAERIGADFTKPYTWDDLITWGKAARELGPDVYLLSMNVDFLNNMVVNYYTKQLSGTTLFDTATGALLVTEENLTKTFEYIKALFDNEVIQPISVITQYNGDNLQSDPNWINGNYVMAMPYISTAAVLMAANPDAEYFAGEFPKLADAKNDGWIVGCPQIIAVSKNTKSLEASLLFLDYFYNNDQALSTLATERSVPPTAHAREIVSKDGNMNPLLAQSVDLLTPYLGLANDPIGSTREAKAVMQDAIEEMAYGMISPAEAAQIVIERYQEMAAQ